MTLVNQSNENKLDSAVETVIETTQDFTDSAYTSHENRERIISTCQKLKHQVITLVEIGKMLVCLIVYSKIGIQILVYDW